MPHMSLEYSANLDARVDMHALCAEMLKAVLATGLFELGAPRIRAIRCEAYAITDRHSDNAFIDVVFRIGRGRSVEDRKRAGDEIFAAAQKYLADLFDAPHFALSLELREIEAEMSWKRNSMHERLRGK